MTLSLRPPFLNDLPPVARGVVVACFFGWILELAFGGALNHYLGLVPAKVIGSGWLWQLFTYVFIHAGFWHFLFNAFMIWMLGPLIESALGSKKFLIYFVFCGAAAGLFTAAVSPASLRPVIGASGAIYGLMYAFAALYPEQIVYMYFLFPMTARQLVVFLAGLSLVLSFTTPNSSVANFTHLSGLVAGWLYFQTPVWLENSAAGRVVARGLEGWRTRSEPRVTSHEVQNPRRVDAILDKISRKGEAALTSAERRELDEYAKTRGGRA